MVDRTGEQLAQHAPTRKRRDGAIDLLRGLCIVSMTAAHLSPGGYAWRVTHVGVWIDGLMGFVLLAGLVVGMVQSRYVARHGVTYGQVKALRRARLVYLGHIGLCALAFFVATVDSARRDRYASVDDAGGWLDAVVATLTLRINPANASILSLYVVLLALTAGAVWLLARGRWRILLAASGTLYVAGHLAGDLSTFPREPGEPGYINWATWQAMYMLALVLGWHWRNARVQAVVTSTRARIAAALATLAVVVLARAWKAGALGDGTTSEAIGWLFADGTLGPGVIALMFAAALAGYAATSWVGQRLPAVSAIGERIGRRSLDCYILLSIAVLVLPSLVDFGRPSVASELTVPVGLVVMFAWATLRDTVDRRRAT